MSLLTVLVAALHNENGTSHHRNRSQPFQVRDRWAAGSGNTTPGPEPGLEPGPQLEPLLEPELYHGPGLRPEADPGPELGPGTDPGSELEHEPGHEKSVSQPQSRLC